MNLKKMFLFGFIFIFVGLAAAVSALHFYTDLALYPDLVSLQQKDQVFEKMILADMHTLEKTPAFKKNDYKADAGPFLQTYIPLLGPKIKKTENKQNQIVERLFRQNPNWVNNKIDFNNLTADPQFADLEPKWIEKIKGYDHWNTYNHPDLQTLIQSAEQQNEFEKTLTLATLPVPDYGLLRNWAAVYAIKKLQTKDLNAGLKIFRKAAELINTTGSLTAQMQAVAMLKAEHKLMNDFQARDWHLIPLRSIEAYRRLSWAWPHLARKSFFEDVKDDFRQYAQPVYGACSGASEDRMGLDRLRDFLGPQVSIEKDFRTNLQRAEKFQDMLLANCHIPDLTHVTVSSSLAPKSWWLDARVLPLVSLAPEKDGLFYSLVQRINWSRVPFVRKYLGVGFLNDGTEYLNLYRELLPPTKAAK